VEEAAEKGWVEAEKAKRWAEKLREGVTTAEDKPKFKIQITNTGGLEHRIQGNQRREAGSIRGGAEGFWGLEEGVHLIRREPEGGKLRFTHHAEGVAKLAELSHHAESEEIRQKASEWLNHLLARAEESGGGEAEEKLEALIEEGAARGALPLTGRRQEISDGGRETRRGGLSRSRRG